MIFKDSMRPAVPDEVQHMRQCSRRIFRKSASALIPPLSSRPVMPYCKAVFDERFEEAHASATQATALATSLICLHLLARDRMRMHSPSSAPSDPVLWIIAPSDRASAKKIANA